MSIRKSSGISIVQNEVYEKKSREASQKEKITAAVASAIKPGAGQVINGDYKGAICDYINYELSNCNPAMVPKEFVAVDRGLIRAISAIKAYRNAGNTAQNK